VAVAIQVSADLTTLTLEDASGQLRAAQEADAEDDEAPPPRADGKLYMTREQWEAQSKPKGEGSSGGSRPSAAGGARWGRARRAPSSGGSSAGPGQKIAADQCHRCGKSGHWARECPTKPKNQAAHLVQMDEEEATLLMA
jgi:hypothetical protein